MRVASWNQNTAVAFGYVYYFKQRVGVAGTAIPVNRWAPFNPGATAQSIDVSYLAYNASLDIPILRPGTAETEVGAFPNPATDKVSLQYTLAAASEAVQVEVYNLSGQIAQQQLYPGQAKGLQTQPVSLEGLAPGFYTYRIVADKQVFTGKFVKQ